MNFIYSISSEWLKKKRSAASWLTIFGAIFSPLIFFIYQLAHFDQLYSISQAPKFWESVFEHCWGFLCAMLLPLGTILTVSLITQLEFRNNTWKQTLVTPQSLTNLFFAKFSVLLIMFVQFFILLGIATYLCGILPAIVYRGIPFPVEAFPLRKLTVFIVKCFVNALPILAIQYLVGLQFKNFLIPLGMGIGLYVASMMGLSWRYGYLLPYIYTPLMVVDQHAVDPKVNRHMLALLYFAGVTIFSYFLFITKREKG